MAPAAAHAYERAAVPAGRSVSVGHLRPRAQARCSSDWTSNKGVHVAADLATHPRHPVTSGACLLPAGHVCFAWMHVSTHERLDQAAWVSGGSWCGRTYGVCLGEALGGTRLHALAARMRGALGGMRMQATKCPHVGQVLHVDVALYRYY